MNTMHRATAFLVVLLVAAAGLVGFVLFQYKTTHGPAQPEPVAVSNDSTSNSSDGTEPIADQSPTTSVAINEPSPAIEIGPSDLALSGPGDGCQLTVTRKRRDGTAEDLTRSCSFDVSPPGLVEISASGYLRAVQSGTVHIVSYHDAAEATANVTIGEGQLPVSDFALDIVPLLTKAGCNTGQCHGSAQGKGGLQLSLFGYDPEGDHATLTRGLEGRRIDPFSPTSSLILLKPTLTMPHAGGLRLRPGSAEEDRMRRWIEAGTPWRDESRGRLERLAVEPTDRFLPTAPADQQIQVIAEYADGARHDVTRLCLFVSNDPGTVTVDKNGLAKMQQRGQADVVVRFANKVATVRLAAPFNDATDFDYDAVPRRNLVDDRVVERLKYMRLPVSPRCSDAEFLRRVYFDLVGHMPDPESREDAHFVEEFLADTDPAKRDKVIDKLLKHSDFIYFWALKFGDLLQINSATMGTATGSYRSWLIEQLRLDRSGKPRTSYDVMVRRLLLAKGSLKGGQKTDVEKAATYYASPSEVGEIAEQVARRFLGVRIRCARCHDHPLDVWTQDDYYGFASFFGGVRVEATGEPLAQEVKIVQENSVKHLRTGETPQPKYLGGAVAEVGDREDMRELLVDWMLDPANPRFSRTAANWVWAHLMGRGMVEPVDDMRETNPATDPALLDDLARHFRDCGFDLRELIRTICQSETYQRTSTALEGNVTDEKFYSHALLKPLSAHQMADAIAQVTKVANTYRQNLGKGTRAIEINDPNNSVYMLDVLGRCDRTGGCEVGALVRPTSLKLALYMIISEEINGKLTRQGSLISDWAAAARETDPVKRSELWAIQIQNIYMRAFCRKPTSDEVEFWQSELAKSANPAEGLEDMVWAILNSREFVMNH